ncbi:restriction endonuclease [Flavobacterium sp. 1]|uniref:restriction endonuclease n=1 Tax=Flavobacterium sp. 1 TaxID=2035200 RepID=UPI000C244D4C|nr:restriction endonuclease [Flavobacterium sp. 1]PJJ11149.1 restriction endonuclease [Flavobacterium sp. 1]
MRNIGLRFEHFIFDLFNSFKLDSNLISQPLDKGVDIEIAKNSDTYGVEVKIYRSRRIPISTIKNSLVQLQYNLQNNKYKGGFLVSTANIEPQIREELKKEFEIEIFDRGILISLTSGNKNLRNELEVILLELSQSGEEDIYDGVFTHSHKYTMEFINFKKTNIPKVNKGKELCEELTALSAGKKTAKEYEIQCERILKYIFENDFSNWQNQTTTVDTLHIFDLIAKISSTNDFWKLLARDFHSRFVVFEFKNYKKKIKQGQVYSTEKYLYKTALRNIAIILTRDGAEKNAITAMEGSLRESGKLIISLDQKDICEMLRMKDDGDDPNTYLTEKIDFILMKLSR